MALLAFRCTLHQQVVVFNADADQLVRYEAEQIPTTMELQDRTQAECGACLAEQIDGLLGMHYDHLDVIADLLKSHAELRRKLERYETFS